MKRSCIVGKRKQGREGGRRNGNFKEPFRASRVFEIFPLKKLQASVDSSVDPLKDNNDENEEN